MKQYTPLPLLLFLLALFSCRVTAYTPLQLPVGELPVGDPLALPAFSFDKEKFTVRIDENTASFITSELKKNVPPTCPRISAKRAVLYERQDGIDVAIRNCMITRFKTLLAMLPLMTQIVSLYEGSPVPGIVHRLQDVPAFQDRTTQSAFEAVLYEAATQIPALSSGFALIVTIPSVTQMMMVLVQAFTVQRDRLSKGMVEVGRKGKSGTCPNKQDIACGGNFCNGRDGKCGVESLFEGCACDMGNTCPGPDKLQLFCEECGGWDPKSGRCKGWGPDESLTDGGGKWKGCYCVVATIGEPYIISKKDRDEFEQIISAGPYIPKRPNEKICKKDSIKDIQAKPYEWKFVNAEKLKENIKEYCHKRFKGIKNAKAGNYEARFQEPKKEDESDQRKWDFDYVKLRIEWGGGVTISATDCEKRFEALFEGCDHSNKPSELNANQFDWKWGGQSYENDAEFFIFPLKSREALRTSYDDKNHWIKVEKENPRDDVNKVRKGKNGKEWDVVALLQCIHAMRDMDPWKSNGKGCGGLADEENCGEDPKRKKVDCMGLVTFSSGHANGYSSWKDCWENTWESLSWEILVAGGISFYANHRIGCCQKCWFGIDEYDMPKRRAIGFDV